MQSLLHDLIIALPIAFAAFMILDLIASLKHLWIACKPSTRVSIPAPIVQPLQETTAPAEESAQLETMPDPWEFEPSTQPIITTPTLTVVPSNLLFLPAAKQTIQVVEVVEPVVAAKRRGRPKKEVAPTPVVTPAKRKGRPRKTA